MYPNPFRENVSLNLYLNTDQKVELKLYNSLGTVISSVSVELNKGSHELNILEALKLEKNISDGVYMLKIRYNGDEELIKMVKQ